MYICLVGPPGVGKTVITTEVEHLWRGVPELHSAPNSLTKSALIDTLNEAVRKIVRPAQIPPIYEYHSLLIASPELSDLIPAYDPPFMSALQSLYDRIPRFHERRRGNNLNIIIEKPQLHMLAATTPSFLNSLMPEGAWDQGFISRTILVFSTENTVRPLFAEYEKKEQLAADLLHDLKIIASDDFFGKMTWEPEAAEAMAAWHAGHGEPRPSHMKLTHYVTRRTAHLLKVCMTMSASSSNSRVITLRDYQRAIDNLTEVESFMPDLFKQTATGGDSGAMDETWSFVWDYCQEKKKSLEEHRIVFFLRERVPAHSVMRVIEIMVRANTLIQDGVDRQGRPLYKAAPRQYHS
jgi:hypothetical protein